MKRPYALLAILLALAVIGFRPIMTLFARLTGDVRAALPITCDYDGMTYPSGGQRQADDGCNVCTCGENGWACTKIRCVPGTEAGVISGALAYPDGRTAQRVCAINLKDDKEYCQQSAAGAGTYAVFVPVGEYWVYAVTDEAPDARAWYSEFVLCGSAAACKDHSPVGISVESGRITKADPQDWQAVGRFDLFNVTPSKYEYYTHNYYPTSAFTAKGRGLAKVEILATLYPPQEDAAFAPVGEASLVSEERGIQTWSLRVPSGFQATLVKARGTSENGDFTESRTLRIVRPVETASPDAGIR